MSLWGCSPWVDLALGLRFPCLLSQCIFDPAVSRLVDSYLRREACRNVRVKNGLDGWMGIQKLGKKCRNLWMTKKQNFQTYHYIRD